MKFSKEKLPSFVLNIIILAGALVAISLMAVGYLRVVQNEEQDRVNQVVQEGAIQSVALIREHLSHDMNHIERIGRNLGQHQVSITDEKVLRRINEDESIGKTFKSITVATPDGTLYGADGKVQGNIASHKHFQLAMAGETVINDIERSVVDNKEVISVTAPIVQNGEIVGIVDGRFLMSSLIEFLSVEAFDGQGYSYMANANGQIFVRSENPNADHSNDFTNIFWGLKIHASVSDEELAEMREDLQAGKTGWISYRWGWDDRTMNYMPVGINDWYFLSVLPNHIVASRAMALTKQAFAFSGALLLVVVVMWFYMNRLRRRGQTDLAEVHRELLTIYNTIPGGVFKCQVDEDFTLIDANDGLFRDIGYTREDMKLLFDNKLIRLVSPEAAQQMKNSLQHQRETGETSHDEVRLEGKDGTKKWVLLSGTITEGPREKPVVYCSVTDISELKSTQEKLRDSKQRYDLIMSETQDVVFEWDLENHTIRHSKIYEQKFGYHCIRENFPQSILDRHLVPKEDEAAFVGLYRKIEEGERFAAAEYRIQKADGTFLWCRVSVMAAPHEGQRVTQAVGIITDIEESKRELQAMTEQAQRDTMTGLYNKTTTERLIRRRLRNPTTTGALLTVDIDNFKEVNDTLGHAGGDTALIEVAHQLRQLFRAGDIVGRVGGDEFTVFAEGMELGENLEQKLRDISAVFNWSFSKADIEYAISCSIGVALFPQDGIDFAALSRRADAALYFAKQNGKNQFAIYNDGMQQSIHGVDAAEPRGKEE